MAESNDNRTEQRSPPQIGTQVDAQGETVVSAPAVASTDLAQGETMVSAPVVASADLTQGETVVSTLRDAASNSAWPVDDDEELVTAPTMFPDSVRTRESDEVASHIHTASELPKVLGGGFTALYELDKELGSGGMGAVFRARDLALHRTVAVKVMHDKVARSTGLVRRFYKEAQITAQLEHPGIVPTYNIEITDSGQPRLAMRLIRGKTLERMLEEARSKQGVGSRVLEGLYERLELFTRICDAVHFAHKKGVIHRDLKPDNIMVGPHRDAYVMDWGLATLRDAKEEPEDVDPALLNTDEADTDRVSIEYDSCNTRYGELLGTVSYMPPEQAKGLLEELSPAADQYALGMMLQEVVTLTPARSADNLSALVTQAVVGERNRIPDWVPSGLRAIIETATAPEVSERYASVKDLAADIRRSLRGEELTVMPDPLRTRVWRVLSKHQTSALISLLLMVVGVATLAVTGLVREASYKEKQTRHARFVAEQMGLVDARAQLINARAAGIQREVAWLAGASRHILASTPEAELTPLRSSELRGPKPPADVRFEERYQQKVSRKRAVLVTSKNPGAGYAVDEQRLLMLEDYAREAFESAGFASDTPARDRGAPLQWVYIATPSGVLLSYPGSDGYTDDYDSRTRPWFQGTLGTHLPQWGRIYGDSTGSGALLPCNEAVYDVQGKLLAVIGADFLLSDVEAAVPLPVVVGYEEAWLVDTDNKVVTHAEGMRNVSGDGELRLMSFPEADVGVAIARGHASGQLVVEDRRYMWSRLSAIRWTYVVAAQADRAAR